MKMDINLQEIKQKNYTTPPTDYANSGMDPIDCAKSKYV